MKVNDENSRPGSICQGHGFADPDPQQNVMDPEHWLKQQLVIVVAGSDDSTVKVWDRRQRNAVHSFNSNFQVTAVVLSDDAQQVNSQDFSDIGLKIMSLLSVLLLEN